MSYDYLVNHALKNVWCTPKQDTQLVIAPTRLTPFGGAWNHVRVLWRDMALPQQLARFHVYQIGQINPQLLGLLAVSEEWKTLAEIMGDEDLIVDVFADTGVQMPRTQVWYQYTKDKNLILAVKEQPLIPIDFNEDTLYVRLYSNAYYNSEEADANADFIEVKGGLMDSSAKIVQLTNDYDTAAARSRGAVVAYVNGFIVNAINLLTVAVGDVAEFVYDASIYKVQTWPVADLPTFNSTLDSKAKYLLHFAGESERGINFHDDADFVISKPGAAGRWKGIYVHRTASNTIRNVTHRDYSFPVQYFNTFVDYREDWTQPLALTIRMFLRKSGYNRPLVNEHMRINELYKMADEDIVAAMVGIQSNVPVWQAAALEASVYCEIMRAQDPQTVTRNMVQQAYGYNATAKLLADTPSSAGLESGQRVVNTSYALAERATAYEYDANGKFLGWHLHAYGTKYTCASNSARLVEMITGYSGDRLDEVYGEVEVPLDERAEYRMYRCPIVNGSPSYNWVDVTGTNAYVVANGKCTWVHDAEAWYPMVRSNKISLTYDLSIPPQAGVLRFSIASKQSHNNTLLSWISKVPQGEYDIILNGNPLIEGVDYIMRFPEVVIISKQHLKSPLTGNQDITIRGMGFCKSDLTREPPGDRGFVAYGMLSQNSRFNLRDDRVLRIVVGGSLRARSDLIFSESDTGVTVPNALNGQPYMVRDIVVPLRGAAVDDTYTLRAASRTVDQQVSDYLSTKLPAPVFETPSAIVEKYPVYSPFLCAIITDLAAGDLVDSRMNGQYNDNVAMEIVQAYEDLLVFDPTRTPNEQDLDYVEIHPHNLSGTVQLSAAQYQLVSRVNRLFLNSQVNLSSHLQTV